MDALEPLAGTGFRGPGIVYLLLQTRASVPATTNRDSVALEFKLPTGETVDTELSTHGVMPPVELLVRTWRLDGVQIIISSIEKHTVRATKVLGSVTVTIKDLSASVGRMIDLPGFGVLNIQSTVTPTNLITAVDSQSIEILPSPRIVTERLDYGPGQVVRGVVTSSLCGGQLSLRAGALCVFGAEKKAVHLPLYATDELVVQVKELPQAHWKDVASTLEQHSFEYQLPSSQYCLPTTLAGDAGNSLTISHFLEAKWEVPNKKTVVAQTRIHVARLNRLEPPSVGKPITVKRLLEGGSVEMSVRLENYATAVHPGDKLAVVVNFVNTSTAVRLENFVACVQEGVDMMTFQSGEGHHRDMLDVRNPTSIRTLGLHVPLDNSFLPYLPCAQSHATFMVSVDRCASPSLSVGTSDLRARVAYHVLVTADVVNVKDGKRDKLMAALPFDVRPNPSQDVRPVLEHDFNPIIDLVPKEDSYLALSESNAALKLDAPPVWATNDGLLFRASRLQDHSDSSHLGELGSPCLFWRIESEIL